MAQPSPEIARKRIVEIIGNSVYHALGLILVGLLYHRSPTKCNMRAGWIMFAGIILFSGSLYLLALTDTRWLGAVTPLGGTCFLIGWGALAWHAARNRRA